MRLDSGPFVRLASVYRLRSDQGKRTDPDITAIEIEHAIREAEQDYLMREAREAAEERPQPVADGAVVVRVPPGGVSLEEIERQAIVQALEMTHWRQKAAAALLGISPRVLDYKMQTHQIERLRDVAA